MNILSCVVAVAVFTAESAAQSCDEGFVLLNDVCIQFDKIRLGGFKTQQERCRERGAFMIAPTDAEAESSLFDYINLQWPRSRPRFWIGLKLRKSRDAGEASNYYWQNSHTKNTQFPSGTLPWEKEFPRRTPAFRCVMSTLRGSWVNARCNTQLALACQYDPKVGRNLAVTATEEFVTDAPFVTTEATESFSEMQDSQDYITDSVTPESVDESIYPTATESYSHGLVTESQIDSPTYETDWSNNKEGDKEEERENENNDGNQHYDDDYNNDNNEDEVDDEADDEDVVDEYTFDSNTGLKMIDDVKGTKWKSDQLSESSTEEPIRFEDTTEEPNANDYDIDDFDFDDFDDDDDDDDAEDDDNWKSYQQLSESTTEKPLIDDNEDYFDDDDDGEDDVNNKSDDFYDDAEGRNIGPKMVDDIQGSVGENDQFFGSATDEPIQLENIIEDPLTYDDDDFSADDKEDDNDGDDDDEDGDVNNEFDDFHDDAEDDESLFVRNIEPKMVDDIEVTVGENDHFLGSATDEPIQPENIIEKPLTYDDDDFSDDDEENDNDDDDYDDVNNEFDDFYDDSEDDESLFVRNIGPKMVDDIQGIVGENDQFFGSATDEPIQPENIIEEALTYDDDDFSDDDEEDDNNEDDDDNDVSNEFDDFYNDAEDDASIFVRNIGPKMVDDIQGTVGENDQFFGSTTDEPIQPKNIIDEPQTYDDYDEEYDNDDDTNIGEDEDDEKLWLKKTGLKMVDDIQKEIPEAETKNEAYEQEKEGEVEGNERFKIIDDFQDIFKGFNVDSSLKDQEDIYSREWENGDLNDEYGSNEIPVIEIPYNSLENNVKNNYPIQDEETDKPDDITIVGPIHEETQLLAEPEDAFKQISNLIDLFSALHLNKYGNTLIFHQEVENYYPASLPVGFNVSDFAMTKEHEENKGENTSERQNKIQYFNE